MQKPLRILVFVAVAFFLTACFDIVAQSKYMEVEKNSVGNVVSLGPARTSDGDKVIYILVSEPKHGMLDTSRMPLVSYAPDLNFVGMDTFRFKLSDGDEESNVATITITVLKDNEENQAPVARITTDGEVLVSLGDMVSLSAETSEDPDGSIISYVWFENGQILYNGLNYDANLSLGSHSVVLRVTDDKNATSEDSIEIIVSTPTG